MKSIKGEKLKEVYYDILIEAGCNKNGALAVSSGLIDTSLRGVDSHGIRLFPHYINALEEGRINKNPDYKIKLMGSSIAIFDADHSFGHAAGKKAMNLAIKMATNNGIGVVAVKKSTHFGAAACFGLMAAKKDMIGLSFTNASPLMKTPGGVKSFFGANPICFTAPMEKEEPFCYDASTTQITWNSVKKCRETNMNLKKNTAYNKEGLPTVNPFEAVFLEPAGDYKGFGLSIIIDVLCSLLTGMPSGDEVSNMYNNEIGDKRFLGQFFVAIDISKFENISIFKNRLQNLAEKVRNEEKANNEEEIYFPGDPEKIKYKKRIKNGLKIEPWLYKNIMELIIKYNLSKKYKDIL